MVTGDLNAEPDADEIRLLDGHKTAQVVPGLVLVDAWSYADPMTPGWTWDRRNPYVAATATARIDYVLVGLPAVTVAGQVRSVRLIGDRPMDGVWPSDHAGVLAELQPAWRRQAHDRLMPAVACRPTTLMMSSRAPAMT